MIDCLHIIGMDIGNAEYMRAARRLRLSLCKAIAVSHSNYDIPPFAIKLFRRRLPRFFGSVCRKLRFYAQSAPKMRL